jgi:ABC-type branched-subunit amino acid transport system substrate-binding protein
MAAALLAASGPALAEGKLKIGALLPMSGEMADFGPAAKTGIDLAIDQINQTGGVLGGPVTVVVADDQSTPQGGVDAARKLVATDKVSGLIGPLAASIYAPVAAAGPALPIISPAVPAAPLQGQALAEVAKDKGYRAVAVLYANGPDGKPLADDFAKALAKLGGRVTGAIGFDPRQSSYRAEVQKAATGHPEALVLIAHSGDGAVIAKQALDSGAFNRFIFSEGMKAPEIIEAIGGQFLDGAAGSAASAPADDPPAEAFKTAYRAKYGELSAKPYVDSAYDAATLLALAAEKAKSTDGAKLRDALRDLTAGKGEKVGPGDFAKAKQLIAAGKPVDYQAAAGHGTSFAQWEIQDGKIGIVRVFEPKQ